MDPLGEIESISSFKVDSITMVSRGHAHAQRQSVEKRENKEMR